MHPPRQRPARLLGVVKEASTVPQPLPVHLPICARPCAHALSWTNKVGELLATQ